MKKKRDCTNGHITDFSRFLGSGRIGLWEIWDVFDFPHFFVDQISLRDFPNILKTPLRFRRKKDLRRHVKLSLLCGEQLPCLSRLRVGPMKI